MWERAQRRENMREILKRKRDGDFVWMDEMGKRDERKTMWVIVLGWERTKRRYFIFESWEETKE